MGSGYGHRRPFLNNLTIATLSAATSRFALGGDVGLDYSDGQGFENLVSLLRHTPRESLLEVLVLRIQKGLGSRQLLGAVAETAAREVSPYPIVGFKYHAFMVMQAVHLASLHGRTADRWLAVRWAADQFKASQARNEEQTGWKLGPTPKERQTCARNAEAEFIDAVEQWDSEAADAALVGLAHAVPPGRMFELLFHFAARDFRHVRHKAITAANCHRLIAALGPGRAMPMLRSLTYAMQNHGRSANPAQMDLAPDRPWRRNLELAAFFPEDWLTQTTAIDPVVELLPVMRAGTDADAAQAVVAMITRGAGPSRIWPALFAAAGELLLHQSGIIAVHANTTYNALHYAFQHTRDDHPSFAATPGRGVPTFIPRAYAARQTTRRDD